MFSLVFSSDLNLSEFTITVEEEKTQEKPVFQENQELEFLIDAIMSCQEAVYPNLKKQYTHARAMEEQQFKLFVSVFQYFQNSVRVRLNTLPGHIRLHYIYP